VYRIADYQDLRLWRRLTVWGAWLLRRALRRHLIVPMAIVRADYFAEITDGLRKADPDLRCVRLTVGEDTLRRRIVESRDRGAAAWRLAHVARGLALAADAAFGMPVSTDGRTAAEVAEAVCSLLRDGSGTTS
jgi:hypothetical protein